MRPHVELNVFTLLGDVVDAWMSQVYSLLIALRVVRAAVIDISARVSGSIKLCVDGMEKVLSPSLGLPFVACTTVNTWDVLCLLCSYA